MALYSALLRPAETKYSVTEQELLAVINSVKQFGHYLPGQRFTLRTDHRALLFMLREKKHDTETLSLGTPFTEI